MITRTSISHPTALRSIRNAVFAAAADCSMLKGEYDGQATDRHGVSYAKNRHGVAFVRADVILPADSDLAKLRFYAAGSGNYNYIWEVADALGSKGFTYMHRLADALASKATVKVW